MMSRMFSTREDIALSLLANVPELDPASADPDWSGMAKYSGALLNAVQSALTLPGDVALPNSVVSSFGTGEVRLIWNGDHSRITAVFVGTRGYGMIGAGAEEIVWYYEDEQGQWLLEALRNAGFIVRRQVPTGVRALEVE